MLWLGADCWRLATWRLPQLNQWRVTRAAFLLALLALLALPLLHAHGHTACTTAP